MKKTAVITGAAGGMGRKVAVKLAKLGYELILIDKSHSGLEACRSELNIDWAVRCVVTDFLDVDAMTRSMSDAVLDVQEVTAVISLAGLLEPAAALDVDLESWDRHFAVNVRSLVALVQTMVPKMRKDGTGGVVAVTSNAALVPRTGMAAYAASKAAAEAFMKCLALEIAQKGIRCNTVAPGSTHTPMLTDLWGDNDRSEATLRGDPDQYRVGIPLGRIASAIDIADGIAFLLSPEARHITMHTLTIDGGASLGL
ncbi:hypothetical protein NS226_08335 [Aureimonas ureilytica]|uniref:Ketoreductase domain-containing protein n=2 Tax=Aureimonas ureilytica TaxID=401562 RepID=A0A175RBZ8_9HYPH|nr:hypothetical protein NS226_08335 [Aureimonas ureilytica]